MLKINILLSFFVFLLNTQNLKAEENAASALQQTQDCLRNQNCISANSDAAKAADARALSAAGGDGNKKQALYNLSAEILPTIEQLSGGDPEKMQAILQKAQSDPAAFLSSLPQDVQAKIKQASTTLK